MTLKQDPLNLEILKLRKQDLGTAQPVKVLDTVEGATTNFHAEGLFSTAIFGRIGDEIRDKQFGYIPLKTEVFHPLIYSYMTELNTLHRGVLNGSVYATYNKETKQLEQSDPMNGNTGFSFFFDVWKEIEYTRSKSQLRNNAIDLIISYKSEATNENIAVLPAGLRDAEIGEDGRMRQHEVNDLYRRMIGANSLIAQSESSGNNPVNDQPRKVIQGAFNDVYNLFTNIISGKNGFIQGKWARRQIFNGTRNVITAVDTSTPVIGSKKSIRFTDTVVGLFQHMKAMEPVTKHLIATGFISRVFSTANGQAYLVDPKTLKAGYYPISTDTYDRWMSSEGLSRVINSYERREFRNKPVMIDGKYIGLIYLGPAPEIDIGEGVTGTFRLFSDIDELPDPSMKEHVRPITLAQLLYLSGYREWNTYPAFVTRYPVATIGSIYPSMAYVKTTTKGEVRQELGEDWQVMSKENIAYEFPIGGGHYFDSLSPHPSRLSYLGGD